jgi:glycosyltransferase involved in cell wall biosynthesis
MSAYSCRPNHGSEPEIGWQWATQMARHHDVTVFTRTKYKPMIEAALDKLRPVQPVPTFRYHESHPLTLRLKRRLEFLRVYYLSWQRTVRKEIAALLATEQFDLLHHVTFSAYRYPSAVWSHGVPCIWGPIGGIESVPGPFLPKKRPGALFYEVVRGTYNAAQESWLGSLKRRANLSDLTLACTDEMLAALNKVGVEAKLMASVGLIPAQFPSRTLTLKKTGPLKILYVGNIFSLKGIDLALEGLHASGTNADFTLIGSGDYMESGKKLTASLGLGERVDFKGRLPQAQTLAAYKDFDVFLFPSLHDTGGFAVVEAMANFLPVICLAVGGPAVLMNENCGFKVALRERTDVIADIGNAIRTYDQNRELLLQHGNAARQFMLKEFDWAQKAEKMSGFYREIISKQRSQLGRKSA